MRFMYLLLFLFSSCAEKTAKAVGVSARIAPMMAMDSTPSSNGAMVAYSASANLAVKNIDKARSILGSSAKDMGGFIVQDSTEEFIVRVPADKLTNYMEALKNIGKVNYQAVTGVNITESYNDAAIRLESFQKVRDKYQDLLKKATTVQDIVSIERELERVNQEIYYLTRQQENSEKKVALSDVYISFQKMSSPGPLGWIFYIVYRGVKWLFWWD